MSKVSCKLWLPKPHEKGADAEAGVVAYTIAGKLDNIYFAVALNAECYSFKNINMFYLIFE